jgi:hypothetical protein
MDKEASVLPSGPYHSLQLCYSCLLRLKIITCDQTDIGEGPTTRGRKTRRQGSQAHSPAI